MKKVLLIDDSAYTRERLRAMIAAMPGVAEVATAIDGFDGYSQTRRFCPDVIVLDLNMPNMDGFTFLRLFGEKKEMPPVIVLSSDRWKDNAKRALSLGAFDFIEKPAAHDYGVLGDELERKIRMLPPRRQHPHDGREATTAPERTEDTAARGAVVIGASTGGPGAVSKVVAALPADFPLPVAVVMHIPGWLAAPYAERLSADAALDVKVAVDAEPVRSGTVLVTPGGFHLQFERWKGRVHTRLFRRSARDIYAPSVDRAFTSAAGAWGPGTTGVVLTGMGSDGASGAGAIKERGGFVVAESKESAAVFSMPESVITSGHADAVVGAGSVAGLLVSRALASSAGLA